MAVTRRKPLIWSVLFLIVLAGAFGSARWAMNHRQGCSYEANSWTKRGFPVVGASSVVFDNAFEVESVRNRSDTWAGQLLCSNQQAEAGRLIQHFATGPNANFVIVSNIVTELSIVGRQNGRYAKARDLEALFSRPSLKDFVEKSEIEKYANLVRRERISFRSALAKLLLPFALNDSDRSILTST